MLDKSKAPVVSHDGRFEVIIEEGYDRGIISYDTVLRERATGKRLFACQDAPRVLFAEDGALTIYCRGFEPLGIQIDPVRGVFRTHPSEPWVSAAAWPIVESAYQRGWSDGILNRRTNQPTPFPWVAIILLIGSIIALPALAAQTFLSGFMTGALVVVAAAGFLLFGWLAAGDFRDWLQERKARNPSGVDR